MVSQNVLEADLACVLEKTLEVWEELRSARIFITGPTGFFGAWLLETAIYAVDQLGLNTQICALSRRSPEEVDHLAHLWDHAALTWIKGDLTSFKFPPGEFSHVIHAGAEASASAHRSAPLHTFDTNLEGTRRCLEFAQEARVSRFLYTSSGAVYGTLTDRECPVDEKYIGAPDPLDLHSGYAQGKRSAEYLALAMAHESDLQVTIARCFAFVGPYQPQRSGFAISSFISDALEGKRISIAGDGTPLRSYLYASDLAEQLWKMLVYAPTGQAFNIGSDQAISIWNLAERIKSVLKGVGVDVLGKPNPSGPVQSYVPNTQRAREILGFIPRVSLDDAIGKSAAWYQHRRRLEKHL